MKGYNLYFRPNLIFLGTKSSLLSRGSHAEPFTATFFLAVPTIRLGWVELTCVEKTSPLSCANSLLTWLRVDEVT